MIELKGLTNGKYKVAQQANLVLAVCAFFVFSCVGVGFQELPLYENF